MDSITFTPGSARLQSHSPAARWSAVLEDEGVAGYLYAVDRTLPGPEQGILDAMLLYNVSSLTDPIHERLAALQWSRDGLQAVFYLDGRPQAFVDFAARESFCRTNFPNFMEQRGDAWRSSSHLWQEDRIQSFEASLYTETTGSGATQSEAGTSSGQ